MLHGSWSARWCKSFLHAGEKQQQEQKIEIPLESDFKKEVVKETKTTVIERKVEIIKEAPKEHTVIVGDFSQNRNEFHEPRPVNNTFANILLFLTGIVVFLFIVHALTIIADVADLIDPAFQLFIFVTAILVVLSAVYAIQRNIFNGFIIVGIILTILLFIGLLLLGNNVWQLVLTIIIVLAIIPTEYYMINANKDK